MYIQARCPIKRSQYFPENHGRNQGNQHNHLVACYLHHLISSEKWLKLFFLCVSNFDKRRVCNTRPTSVIFVILIILEYKNLNVKPRERMDSLLIEKNRSKLLRLISHRHEQFSSLLHVTKKQLVINKLLTIHLRKVFNSQKNKKPDFFLFFLDFIPLPSSHHHNLFTGNNGDQQ